MSLESEDGAEQHHARGAGPPKFSVAAAWSFLMQGGRQGLKLGLTFVLAAILGPEVYGVAMMALVFVMFVDMLQQQGMAAALIQRRELTTSHLDTAFFLLAGSGVVLVLATLATAGWWADVNDTPELQGVIIAMTPIIPLKNLSIVQSALLRRELAFKALAQRDLVAVTAGGVVGLACAFGGLGVWSLVAQQVTMEAVAVVVLWRVSAWRPGTKVTRRAARDLLAFSSGLLLSSVGNFLNNQSDTLLIGLFFGPRVVGIYRLGLRLVETLVTVLTRSVQSVGLPDLARCVHEPAELRRRLDRLARLAAATTVPALGVLAGVAVPLVALLGDEWAAAAGVVQVLCLVGVIRAWVVIDGPLLVATGSTFIQAATSWMAGILSAVAFSVAGVMLQDVPADAQALGIAIARTIVWGIAIAAIHVWILHRYAEQRLGQMVAPLVWPVAAGTAAAGAGIAWSGLVATGSGIVDLALTGLVSATTGAAILWTTDGWVRSRVRRVLASRRSRAGRRQSTDNASESSDGRGRHRV